MEDVQLDRVTLQAMSSLAVIRSTDERSEPRAANYDQRANAYARFADAADALDALIARDELNNLLGSPPQKTFPEGYGES